MPVYQVSPTPPAQDWNPLLAAFLSFLIPGVGQLYRGQIAAGLLWFFLVPLAYVLFVIPGLILHIICIFGAIAGNSRSGGGLPVILGCAVLILLVLSTMALLAVLYYLNMITM
jgi:TM2 domain-containing membrane protein YozV